MPSSYGKKNRNIDIELIVLTQFKELLTYLADGRIRIGSKSEELDSDIYVHPWFKLKGEASIGDGGLQRKCER